MLNPGVFFPFAPVVIGPAVFDGSSSRRMGGGEVAVIAHPHVKFQNPGLEGLRSMMLGNQQCWPADGRVTLFIPPPNTPGGDQRNPPRRERVSIAIGVQRR